MAAPPLRGAALDGRYIWDLLNAEEYAAVMATCPDSFVFRREENPSSKAPALIPVLYSGITNHKAKPDKSADAPKMVSWLIERGEDPAQITGSGWAKKIWKKVNKEDTSINLVAANESPVSFVLKARRLLKENMKQLGDEIADWSAHIERCDAMLPLLYDACGNTRRQREKLPIDMAIVERWSQLSRDTATHDVTFEADDGSVGAHSALVSLASPVLCAMLSSGMMEGQTKRVRAHGFSKDAIELLLEILYTGCTTREIKASPLPPPRIQVEEARQDAGGGAAAGAASDAAQEGTTELSAAICAHELAHSWQLPDVQALLEQVLGKLLSDASFFELAKTAQLRGSQGFVEACKTYGMGSSSVQLAVRAGGCAPEVLELLGMAPREDGRAKKRLRSL